MIVMEHKCINFTFINYTIFVTFIILFLSTFNNSKGHCIAWRSTLNVICFSILVIIRLLILTRYILDIILSSYMGIDGRTVGIRSLVIVLLYFHIIMETVAIYFPRVIIGINTICYFSIFWDKLYLIIFAFLLRVTRI